MLLSPLSCYSSFQNTNLTVVVVVAKILILTNVILVDRIPISPYTRSPQSTAAAAKGLRIGIADAAETPHSVPSSVTRRITRSSPRKSLQPCKPLTPISQPAKHRMYTSTLCQPYLYVCSIYTCPHLAQGYVYHCILLIYV